MNIEISKAKIPVLLLMMLLMVAVSPIIASAEAQVIESSRIKFNAYIAGECSIGYNSSPELPIPWPDPPVPGRGSIRIVGQAKDVQDYIGELWPFPYVSQELCSENVKALGFVSLEWTETDGSESWLLAIVYSTASAGLFTPDYNYFTLGTPGDPSDLTKFLNFRGIHRSGTEIQRISGFGLFQVWGTYIDTEIISHSILMLVDEKPVEENTLYTLYEVAWLAETAVIESNVEVLS